MNKNRNDPNGKVHTKILAYKHLILISLLILFLGLSVVSMFSGKELSSIGFIIATGVILLFIFPETVESLRFGNVEVKMRQVRETVKEARSLAKLIAEIAIPLAHHSTGWADTARSTVQMKDAVIRRVLALARETGLELSDEILEMNYVKTCSDYEKFIIQSLSKDRRSSFINELGVTHIPTKIEDVPTPERIETILMKLGCWDEYMEVLVEDYRHYYKNRTHRNQSRWDERADWQRPEMKDE